jgi:hypothetical protein
MAKNNKINKIKNKDKDNNKDDNIESIDVSDLSSVDDDMKIKELSVDDISKDARKKYVENTVKEQVTKYLNYDNEIRKARSELKDRIKILSKKKIDAEEIIINYLDEVNKKFNLEKPYLEYDDGKGKLIKTVSKTKESIKIDNVEKSLNEIVRKHNLFQGDEKMELFLKEFIENIEAKRKVKERTYIKRTMKKNKREKNSDKKMIEKKNNHYEKNEDNENDHETDEEDLPKYKPKK